MKHLIKRVVNHFGYEISKISHKQANDLYLTLNDGYIEPSATDDKKPALIDDLPLNYGISFVCSTSSSNSVRFWVESRTILIDGDQRYEFFQCSSCKSENVFVKKNLFMPDNYDFLPVFGKDGQSLIFRRRKLVMSDYRQTVEHAWGPVNYKLYRACKATLLESWEQIRDVTAAAMPIILRTEIAHLGTGLRAIIEAPVKTINISPDRQMYQVDTGPVCLPDLSRRHKRQINCLKMAYVAFNAPQFVDFVIEEPVSVIKHGQECCQVFHYSTLISLPAKNSLLALEYV